MEENNCMFVNSRGILKSCNFKSLNPISSCDNDFHYLEYMLKNAFDGMSIYVCTNLLQHFVMFVLPRIRNCFIIITGDSDESIPLCNHDVLLNNKYLLKWYAQNLTNDIKHNKLSQIPIGLDYHTIFANPYHNWKKENENYTPVDQEKILIDFIKNMKPFYERQCKIYITFNTTNDRYNQRKKALSEIPSDLPVLLVDEWSDINILLLQYTIETFKNKNFDYEKLLLGYWIDKISNLL